MNINLYNSNIYDSLKRKKVSNIYDITKMKINELLENLISSSISEDKPRRKHKLVKENCGKKLREKNEKFLSKFITKE